MYVCIYVYTYIYTYIHMYIHICKLLSSMQDAEAALLARLGSARADNVKTVSALQAKPYPANLVWCLGTPTRLVGF